LIKITYNDNINTTNEFVLNVFYGPYPIIYKIKHSSTPTSDISSITTSCNCSYRHVNLFNESNDNFVKLDNDYWVGMFNVECIVKSSILKATLYVDAISKALVFVKSEDLFLLYNHNNP
jgi:hypothetical protein